MKKLFILTAVTGLLASAAGCRCCDWLFRGASYNPCAPAPAYGATAYPEPCVVGTPGACDACGAAPIAAPGPIPYTVAPTGAAPSP